MSTNNNDNSKSAMDSLNLACGSKVYQSFQTLSIGDYIVNHFSTVTTPRGDRIRIDLDESYMLLPERFFNLLNQEKLDLLNKSPKIMIYGGKDHLNRSRLILEFRDSAYYAETLNFNSE